MAGNEFNNFYKQKVNELTAAFQEGVNKLISLLSKVKESSLEREAKKNLLSFLIQSREALYSLYYKEGMEKIRSILLKYRESIRKMDEESFSFRHNVGAKTELKEAFTSLITRIEEILLNAEFRIAVEEKDYISAASISLKMGNKERAGEYFEMGGEYSLAGSIWEETGNLDRALENFRKVDDLESIMRVYMKQGKYLEAGEIALKLGMKKEAAEYFEKGGEIGRSASLYEELGMYEKATKNYMELKDYSSALRIFVNRGDLENAGKTCEMMGDYREAAKLFEKAGNLKRAAENYLKCKEYDEAIRVYPKLADENPGLMADVYYEKGDFATSLFLYIKSESMEKVEEVCRRIWEKARGINNEEIKRVCDVLMTSEISLDKVLSRCYIPFIQRVNGEMLNHNFNMEKLRRTVAEYTKAGKYFKEPILIGKMEPIKLTLQEGGINELLLSERVNELIKENGLEDEIFASIYLLKLVIRNIGDFKYWVIVERKEEKQPFSEVKVGIQTIKFGKSLSADFCMFYFPGTPREGESWLRFNSSIVDRIEIAIGKKDSVLNLMLSNMYEVSKMAIERCVAVY